MNTERLLRLAEYLDAVPPEAFDMRNWATRTPCGTVCCALGHACSIPEFAAAGLSLHWDAAGSADVRYDTDPGSAAGRRHAGFRAAAWFFGLDHDDAHDLFDPAEYTAGVAGPEEDDDDFDDRVWASVTPRQVADRIRELVRRGEVTGG